MKTITLRRNISLLFRYYITQHICQLGTIKLPLAKLTNKAISIFAFNFSTLYTNILYCINSKKVLIFSHEVCIERFIIFPCISWNEYLSKIPYISGNKNSEKRLIFQETKLLRSSSKNKKKSAPRKFSIFWEMRLSGSNIKKFLLFVLRKAFLIFREN